MGNIITIEDEFPFFEMKESDICLVKDCSEKAYIWIHINADHIDLCWRNRKTLEFQLVEKGKTTIIRIALCPKHFREWKHLQTAFC